MSEIINLLNKDYFEIHCCKNSQCVDFKECLNLEILNGKLYDTDKKANIKLKDGKMLLVELVDKDNPQYLTEFIKKVQSRAEKKLNKDLLEQDLCQVGRIAS